MTSEKIKKSEMPILKSPAEMQRWAGECRAFGKTIGCVPTMGALHEGHLSLIRASASECDATIVTIFVNPLQFGPSEDFSKYPRNENKDLDLAKEAGASAAYCPSNESMYYPDCSVFVNEEKLSQVLCGKSRPTHFQGVATVVAKLFNTCLPDKAYFGMKDYQQLLIIERMVRDLDFPVQIVRCPIVREPDGIAMSSRNRYLSKEERIEALALKRSLDRSVDAFHAGQKNPREIEKLALGIIEKEKSAKVDYIECRDAFDLSDIQEITRPAVLALAVFIGKTRLIDNVLFSSSKEE
jgi:pantoate--beta-alanine ligase